MGRGEQDRASRLLSRALDVSRDTSARTMLPLDWSTVLVETELLALQHHPEEALTALRRAIDGGWRWEVWQLEHDPTLADIRSEPAFGAMLAEVKTDLTAQLERVREQERSGLVDGLPPRL